MPRRGLQPTINTEKHYGQLTLTSVAFGVVSNGVLIDAVAVSDKTAASEVEEGSTVKTIFIERWITSDDAEQSTMVLIVEKVPAGQAPATAAQMANLNDYPNKKNVLYTTQGIVNPVAGVTIPGIRQWITIPNGKRRFGLGDRLFVNILAQADGLNICGFQIFKEWK